jgi:hypothetical protein
VADHGNEGLVEEIVRGYAGRSSFGLVEMLEASSKDESCLTVETGRWPVSEPPSGDELN